MSSCLLKPEAKIQLIFWAAYSREIIAERETEGAPIDKLAIYLTSPLQRYFDPHTLFVCVRLIAFCNLIKKPKCSLRRQSSLLRLALLNLVFLYLATQRKVLVREKKLAALWPICSLISSAMLCTGGAAALQREKK